jgi:putative transposase
MPWELERYHQFGHAHFITFSCYGREPLLAAPRAKLTFLKALERVRCMYDLRVYGYVVMPEHVHLLLSEPRRCVLSVALKSLKQGVSRRLIRTRAQFWEKRYYDFNVFSQKKWIEKLQYLHRNPVHRGLCTQPEQWLWSSFNHYATGEEGVVEIESHWTVRKRERMGLSNVGTAPLKPKEGLNGAPVDWKT